MLNVPYTQLLLKVVRVISLSATLFYSITPFYYYTTTLYYCFMRKLLAKCCTAWYSTYVLSYNTYTIFITFMNTIKTKNTKNKPKLMGLNVVVFLIVCFALKICFWSFQLLNKSVWGEQKNPLHLVKSI